MATACITGASSGIGMEFAKQLSRMGYDLILIARHTDILKNMAKTLPVRCQVMPCDLSIEADCIALADRLQNRKIHILINNAGFGDLGDFDKTDLSKEMDMINVNIKALHILTKKLLPGFKKRGRGYILNVASSAGLLPGGPHMATYYATKAYVTSLTSAISTELKEAGSNVHISMLCPGPVNTNFNNVAGVTFSLNGIPPAYCASYALKHMFRGKLTIVPSLTMKLAVNSVRFIPRWAATAITSHQQKKKQ